MTPNASQNPLQSLDEVFASLRQPYLERRDGYFQSEATVFARVIGEGQRIGAFENDDATAVARALVTGTNALLPYSLSPQELGSRRDVERELARLSDILIRGLAPRTRSEAGRAGVF